LRVSSLLHISSFLFTHTATIAIYTLSLHDALPIYDDFHLRHRGGAGFRLAGGGAIAGFGVGQVALEGFDPGAVAPRLRLRRRRGDRKSTRLNSSHVKISYAVFCLKKKNKEKEG